MPKYIVTRKELYGQGVSIEADSPEDALEKVADGEGEDIESLLEYLDTLDRDLWDVEEIKEG